MPNFRFKINIANYKSLAYLWMTLQASGRSTAYNVHNIKCIIINLWPAAEGGLCRLSSLLSGLRVFDMIRDLHRDRCPFLQFGVD